jgi:hypothetical protein
LLLHLLQTLLQPFSASTQHVSCVGMTLLLEILQQAVTDGNDTRQGVWIRGVLGSKASHNAAP